MCYLSPADDARAEVAYCYIEESHHRLFHIPGRFRNSEGRAWEAAEYCIVLVREELGMEMDLPEAQSGVEEKWMIAMP